MFLAFEQQALLPKIKEMHWLIFIPKISIQQMQNQTIYPYLLALLFSKLRNGLLTEELEKNPNSEKEF